MAAMTSGDPLGFQRLENNRHVSISGENNKRAQHAWSNRYTYCNSNVSLVYSNRPIDIGETVYLRFGPKMSHLQYTIGFYVNVGFTNRNPNTLPCSVSTTNIPGFWVSKIYTSNDSTLHFTLDPSGIVDFHGPMIGNHTFESLQLGELSGPYWAVISVPEHPFNVEFAPPPPDAKPTVRKDISPQKPQSSEDGGVSESTVQRQSDADQEDKAPVVTVAETSMISDTVPEASLQSYVAKESSVISGAGKDIWPPSDAVKGISQPSDSGEDISHPCDSPKEISPSSDTVKEISRPSVTFEKKLTSNSNLKEILPPSVTGPKISQPIDVVPEISLSNVTVTIPEVAAPRLTVPEISQLSEIVKEISPSSGTLEETSNSRGIFKEISLPSATIPAISAPSVTYPKISQTSEIITEDSSPNVSLDLKNSSLCAIAPKKSLKNISVLVSSTPNTNFIKESFVNSYVPVKSPSSETVPVTSSQSTVPVSLPQDIVVPIISSTNSLQVMTPQSDTVSVTLERCIVPVSSSPSAVTSSSNGGAHEKQNGPDLIQEVPESGDNHTHITINQYESDHLNLEGETLLEATSEAADRRTNKWRCYCITFAFVLILVLAAATILYFAIK